MSVSLMEINKTCPNIATNQNIISNATQVDSGIVKNAISKAVHIKNPLSQYPASPVLQHGAAECSLSARRLV